MHPLLYDPEWYEDLVPPMHLGIGMEPLGSLPCPRLGNCGRDALCSLPGLGEHCSTKYNLSLPLHTLDLVCCIASPHHFSR